MCSAQRPSFSLQRINGVLRTVDAALLHSSTRKIEVWTTPALSTLAAEKGTKGVLRVSRVLVPPSTPAIVPAAGASLGVRAVAIAERFLGVPYLWAGADPHAPAPSLRFPDDTDEDVLASSPPGF